MGDTFKQAEQPSGIRKALSSTEERSDLDHFLEESWCGIAAQKSSAIHFHLCPPSGALRSASSYERHSCNKSREESRVTGYHRGPKNHGAGSGVPSMGYELPGQVRASTRTDGSVSKNIFSARQVDVDPCTRLAICMGPRTGFHARAAQRNRFIQSKKVQI